MLKAQAIAFLREQALRTQNLFHAMVRLHTVSIKDHDHDPLRDLDDLIRDAQLIGRRLKFLRHSFSQLAPKSPDQLPICPNALPLSPDTQADLEQ